MYQDSGVLMDAETLLGYRKDKASEQVWNMLVGARDWADRLLDYVDIRDGRTSPDQYNHWILEHAIKHGTLYVSNSEGVVNYSNPKTYIDTFTETKIQTLDNGDIEQVVIIKHGDEEIVMKKNERYYVAKRPKEITIVIGDHVGKYVGQPGLSSKKQIIDKASEYSADARDIYGYSPVLVSQFNRAIGDVQRMKFSDGDLSPQIEDFKDTGNIVEDETKLK